LVCQEKNKKLQVVIMKAPIYSSFGVEEEYQEDAACTFGFTSSTPPLVAKPTTEGALNTPLLDETHFTASLTPRGLEGAQVPLLELKRSVVNMCSRIFRSLGPGFRELCYQKALEVELNRAHIRYLCQAPVPIYYMQEVIAIGYADIIVDGRLILELKAAKTPVAPGHLNQCRGYMRASGIQHGFVINFPQYKPRNTTIDVYDCYLGNNYPVDPTRDLSEQEIQQADDNQFGPSSGRSAAQTEPIESYEAQQMETEAEDGVEGFPSTNREPIHMTLPPIKRRIIEERGTSAPLEPLPRWGRLQ
jgi:GxxExxY protein